MFLNVTRYNVVNNPRIGKLLNFVFYFVIYALHIIFNNIFYLST